MQQKIVLTKNLARLSDASEMLLRRAPGLPGMGLVHGETGTGKTTAVAWMTNRYHGVYVRALAAWTPSAMFGAILRELGRHAHGSCAQMMTDIVEALSLSGRPVFIDEADYLVDNKRMSESLRDIHDLTTVPVLLVGMAGIDQRLSARKQLTGRVLQDVHFEALDREDAKAIAKQLCDVSVAADLLDGMHRATGGYVRNLVVALARVEEYAKSRGMDKIDANAWGKRSFITGEAPHRKPALHVVPEGSMA
ncbi:MAG TPA: ATP-binding protein [Oleiagrimonas sp.]|nr:ATP-binding protein [Oleiagrimonas sp.]